MRYYFTLKDGETFIDTDGSDLADLKAAEREASKIAAEWLRDNPDAPSRRVAASPGRDGRRL